MTYDVNNQCSDFDLEFLCPVGAEERKLRHTLIQTLGRFFVAIVQVNLRDDTVTVLQSADASALLDTTLSWSGQLEHYGTVMESNDLMMFSSKHLLDELNAGQSFLEEDISYIKNGRRAWLTVTALLSEENGSASAMILVRESSREHMLQRIVDLYVYNSSDFFLSINPKDNSYISLNQNKNGAELFPETSSDYTAEVARYVKNFVVSTDQERVLSEMSIARVLEGLENKTSYTFTCGVMDPNQGYRRKQLTYQYYDRSAQMILLSQTDITDAYLEMTRYQEEIRAARQEARTDALTGLCNLQGTVESATAYLQEEGEQAALLFIDLDNFKNINDTLGHSAGDQLLQEVAKILLAHVRRYDLVGRIGGDEFLVYLRHVSSVDIARQRATQLHEAINDLSQIIGITVSCSIGIAFAPADGTDYTTLIKCADYRTYQAKSRGKNQHFID